MSRVVQGYFVKFAAAPDVVDVPKAPTPPHKRPINGSLDDRAAIQIQRILASNPELKKHLAGEFLAASGHGALDWLQSTPLGRFAGGEDGVPLLRDLIRNETLRRAGFGTYRAGRDTNYHVRRPGVQFGGPTLGQIQQDMLDKELSVSRDLGRIRAALDRNPKFRSKLLDTWTAKSDSEGAEKYRRWARRTKRYIPTWFGWRDKVRGKLDAKALDAMGIKAMQPRMVPSGGNPNIVLV